MILENVQPVYFIGSRTNVNGTTKDGRQYNFNQYNFADPDGGYSISLFSDSDALGRTLKPMQECRIRVDVNSRGRMNLLAVSDYVENN